MYGGTAVVQNTGSCNGDLLLPNFEKRCICVFVVLVFTEHVTSPSPILVSRRGTTEKESGYSTIRAG